MVWYSIVWYGMMWYAYVIVWYRIVWYYMVWYGTIWYCIVWCGLVLYDQYCIILFDIIPWMALYSIVWCGMECFINDTCGFDKMGYFLCCQVCCSVRMVLFGVV